MSYLSAVRNAFRIPDIRSRLLTTGFLLLVYKLLTIIPAPGITPDMIEQARASEVTGTAAFQAINVLSGGALVNLSIVALSIYPFLAAVEMVNNFIPVFPRLQQIAREPGAKDKLHAIAVRLTIPLAIISALVGEDIALPLLDIERTDFLSGLTVVTALVAGTFLTMWIADLITESGIGNGIALIIYTNIIGEVPTFFAQMGTWGPIKIVVLVLLLIALLYIMIQLREGVRRIPVQYGKRIRTSKPYGGSDTYIPFAIMPSYLNPIESGYGLMILIGVVLLYLIENHPGPTVESVNSRFWQIWPVLLFFYVLIATFRAIASHTDEEKLSTRLQQQGGFIPGIRPGQRTHEYIRQTALRLGWISAPFLAFLSILPWWLQWVFGLEEPAYLVLVLWVSIRIVIDVFRQLEAQLAMRNFQGFMS